MSEKANEVKQAAQRFASKGFKVFPRYGNINPKNWNGKKLDNDIPREGWHPKADGSGKEFNMPATTDVNKIAEWPDELYSNGLTNYGINPTRRAIIVDVDNYDKPRQLQTNVGSSSLDKLVDAFDVDVSSAFKVKSKSPGCFHLYFSYPSYLSDGEWIRSSTSPKIDDFKYESIDIRADRAFVVGPTPSGPYKITSDISKLGDLPELPRALVEHLIVRENTNNIAAEAETEDIPPGGRDDHMFRLMCKLKGLGLAKDRANAVIREEFTKLAQPEGDEISLDHFLGRMSELYEDESYSANPYQVKLSEYHESLVLLASPHGVFNQKTKTFVRMDAARNTYRHTVTIETTDAKGESKTKKIDIFEVWVKSNDRQQAQGIGYKPKAASIYECETSSGRDIKLVNKYVAPDIRTNKSDSNRNVEMWGFLMDYIWEQDAEYASKWCAHIIQEPEHKIQHMLMLISNTHGVGKDAFFKGLAAVLGRHNTAIIQLENLEEKYNSYMQDSLLVLVNESSKLSDHKSAAVNAKFKFMVTSERMPIRRMGTDVEMHHTYANLIMFGNSTSIMRVDEEDNRIFPHICKKKEPLPEEFAVEFHAALKTKEFAEDLHAHFKSMDLTGFKYFGRAPESSDKRQLVLDNKPAILGAIEEWIETKSNIFSVDLFTQASFEFAVNEEFGFSFINKGSRGFLRNLWRDVLKNSELLKEVRIQRIKMRTGGQQGIQVSPSTSTPVYTIRDHDMYTPDMDNEMIIKRLFEGLENVDSLCSRAMGLSARTKKILGQ